MRAPANMADAVEVIVDLFTSKKIMFLALCEVNKDSFNHISSELGKLGLSLSAQFLPDRTLTGAEFDVGYIYESGEISVIQGMAHTARLGTSIVKVAQQLIIVINGDASSVINIFVSHWPSQLRKIADDFRDECSKEGANKQVISSQADSLIKISRIWADFFPANTSNQPI